MLGGVVLGSVEIPDEGVWGWLGDEVWFGSMG